MAKYAAATTVPVERSRAEIEKTLTRYGATGFMYGWEGTRAVIAFRAQGRMIRFELALPDRADPEFTTQRINQHRTARTTPDQAAKAWEQACRQKWRALALVIKAKLEAVESGIVSFEEEFLAHIMLPNNQTVGQWLRPQVEQAYLGGAMPGLLPLPAHAGGDDGE